MYSTVHVCVYMYYVVLWFILFLPPHSGLPAQPPACYL